MKAICTNQGTAAVTVIQILLNQIGVFGRSGFCLVCCLQFNSSLSIAC